MKFSWPPDETKGWTIYTEKTDQNIVYFPLLPLHQAFLAVQTNTETPLTLFLRLRTAKEFVLTLQPKQWTYLPYAIEGHMIGELYTYIETDKPCTLNLASYHWNLRQFRMRAYVDSQNNMLMAIKYNKNSQLMSMLAYDNNGLLLSEDCYVCPLLEEMPEKQLHLVSAKTLLPTKTLPEGRYFSYMKNETQEQKTDEY